MTRIVLTEADLLGAIAAAESVAPENACTAQEIETAIGMSRQHVCARSCARCTPRGGSNCIASCE